VENLRKQALAGPVYKHDSEKRAASIFRPWAGILWEAQLLSPGISCRAPARPRRSPTPGP
jgi:hypothetical protein